MPLNTLRLNHQVSIHPNERIVFIKPLPRPPSDHGSFELADRFLRAIAAQCLPIMKKHYLSVTTLEEYEPNPEFIGRNFNNGEVIQLVLRSKNGGWVPFNFVQMVMMHELAHNVHMNHGKGFWAERNKFSNELRELWATGYTGEGFWGNGRTLESVQAVAGNNTIPSQELADLQVCGGTFRSRGRKRKRARGRQDLTWKERHDKRIEKKFGKNGRALGEDEGRRMMLEVGKKGSVGGKPRVANSKRGRELRAAAALARVGTNNTEPETVKEEDVGDDSEFEEEYDDVDVKAEDARDVNGQRLLDSMGLGMLRVCGGEREDGQDVHIKQEMDDLIECGIRRKGQSTPASRSPSRDQTTSGFDPRQPVPSPPEPQQGARRAAWADPEHSIYSIPQYRGSPTPSSSSSRTLSSDSDKKHASHTNFSTAQSVLSNQGAKSSAPAAVPSTVNCPICSMANDRLNPTCTACAHVLDPEKVPRHWRCGSEVCQDSAYVNADDCGVCGVCGTRRPQQRA
jgi:hypothetical protein